jgi:hypothetical protein
MDVCTTAVPALVEIEQEHYARCYLHSELKEPRTGPAYAEAKAGVAEVAR